MREYSTKNSKSLDEMRTDASANRLTIINTARILFIERGPDLSMSEIAKAAKVSRATLYRNFEDKSDLVVAMMIYNLDELELFAQELEKNEDEFSIIIKKVVELQFLYQGLIPYLPESSEALIKRLTDLMQGPVERAKKLGILSANFDVLTDTVLVLTMLASAPLKAIDLKHNGMMERAVEIVFKGIS